METRNSNVSLIKATFVALLVAAIALVLLILPAEYNIDPTGVGETLGLTVFKESATKPVQIQTQSEQDMVILTVPAGRGIEYKLAMKRFTKASYEWVTDQGEVYVDLHGEPSGDTSGYFESYAIATVSEMKGSFTAPFDGSHGWYWKNQSDKDIQIQLIFSGEYTIEGLKQ